MLITTLDTSSRPVSHPSTAAYAHHEWLSRFPQNKPFANALAAKGLFSLEELALLHRSDVFRTNVISPRHARWMDALMEANETGFLPEELPVIHALVTRYAGKGGVPLRLTPYAVPGLAENGPRMMIALRIYGVRSVTDLSRMTEAAFLEIAHTPGKGTWGLPQIRDEELASIRRLMKAFSVRFEPAG